MSEEEGRPPPDPPRGDPDPPPPEDEQPEPVQDAAGGSTSQPPPAAAGGTESQTQQSRRSGRARKAPQILLQETQNAFAGISRKRESAEPSDRADPKRPRKQLSPESNAFDTTASLDLETSSALQLDPDAPVDDDLTKEEEKLARARVTEKTWKDVAEEMNKGQKDKLSKQAWSNRYYAILPKLQGILKRLGDEIAHASTPDDALSRRYKELSDLSNSLPAKKRTQEHHEISAEEEQLLRLRATGMKWEEVTKSMNEGKPRPLTDTTYKTRFKQDVDKLRQLLPKMEEAAAQDPENNELAQKYNNLRSLQEQLSGIVRSKSIIGSKYVDGIGLSHIEQDLLRLRASGLSFVEMHDSVRRDGILCQESNFENFYETVEKLDVALSQMKETLERSPEDTELANNYNFLRKISQLVPGRGQKHDWGQFTKGATVEITGDKVEQVPFERLVAIAEESRASILQVIEERRAQGEVVGEPDFSAREYNDLPFAIIQDMAAARGLVPMQRDGLMGQLLLADANNGIAPSDASVVDALSIRTLPRYTRSRLLAIATQARKLLQERQDRQKAAGQDVSQLTFERAVNYYETEARTLRVMVASRIANTDSRPVRFWSSAIAGSGRAQDENILIFLDAREGIDPPIQRYGSSRFHAMSKTQLQEECRRQGAAYKIYHGTTMESMRAWLMQNGSSASTELLSEEDARAIVDVLMPELLRSIQFHGARDVSSIFDQEPRNITTSHNQQLVAPAEVYSRLEATVSQSILPAHTSNTGFLCGPRALMDSLHTTRLALHRQGDPQDDPPERITLDYVMRFMFENYDARTANDPDSEVELNAQGEPTAAFANFLVERLQDFGLIAGSETYEEEWRQMTTMNNLNITHLALILDFLHDQRVIREQFALGLVTAGRAAGGGRAAHPAMAQIVGRNDPSVPLVWIYNDNAEYDPESGAEIGHYSAFRRNGDMWNEVSAMGLHLPDEAEFPHPPTAHRSDMSLRAEMRRAATREQKARKRRADKCLPCQESGAGCSGAPKVAGVSCVQCKELNVDCTWPETAFERPIIYVGAAGVTEVEMKSWDKPDPDWDMIEEVTKLAIPSPLPDETTPHFLTVVCMRMSSDHGPAVLAQLLARIPGIRQRFNNYMNSGANTPEAQRPGGPGTHMRHYGLVTARRGVLPVPTQLTNGLADPRLRGFVNLMHHVSDPNNANKPIRIQLLTCGIAGLQVGIEAFGDRSKGFFHFMLTRDPQLARSIDLVSLAQPHVIQGFPHSLPAPLAAPGVHWQHHQNRYIFANRLVDLIDRSAAIKFYSSLNPPQAPPLFLNHAVVTARLDAHLLALDDEWAWRAHHLAGYTAPTDTEVRLRNHGRNAVWA